MTAEHSDKCPKCGGRGVLLVKEDVPFSYDQCTCVYYRRVAKNVDRGWRGLFKAAKLPKGEESPLDRYWNKDLWITSNLAWFRRHLRWVAVRRPPTWHFKVVSDSDLVVSWLGSIALKGGDILDPDAATVSAKHLTLVDLVEPPSLLVIRLGVKSARNVATSEVFLEALQHRSHIGKPTWVFNESDKPFGLSYHAYSEDAHDFLCSFDRMDVKGEGRRQAMPTRSPTFNMSLSGDEGDDPDAGSEMAAPKRRTFSPGTGGTQAVSGPQAPPKPPKKKKYPGRRGKK